MTLPTIRFRDERGLLRCVDDGVQRTRLFRGPWYIELDQDWDGGVAILGRPEPVQLERRSAREFRRAAEPDPVLRTQMANLGRTAGRVEAVLTRSGQLLHNTRAYLEIGAGNLEDAEYQKLVQQIGQLALAAASHVTANVQGGLGEEIGAAQFGRAWRALNGPYVAAGALIELGLELFASWSKLSRQPLRSLRQETGPVSVERARLTGRTMVQRVLEPERRMLLGTTLTESTDCPENQFLCYVIDVYLARLARALADELDAALSVAEHLPEGDLNLWGAPRDFVEQTRIKARERNEANDRAREIVHRRAKRLRAMAQWAEGIRQEAFLCDIQTPLTEPTQTQRLLGTPSYRPVVDKFNACQGGAMKEIARILSLLESIWRGEVRPTCDLYEIWCVLQVYGALMREANMAPPQGSPTLFEAIGVVDGALNIPRERAFQLQQELDTGRLIHVTFRYEPKLTVPGTDKWKTPDIVLDVNVDGDQRQFALDAKYRNYAEMGPHAFDQDIYKVAYRKYLETFQITGMEACFLLHSDADEKNNFWGETRPREVLSASVFPEELGWAGHRYGAISLRPDEPRWLQLKKLIALLFQYHCEQNKVCLNCGYELKPGVDIQPGKVERYGVVVKTVGHYCLCPKCATSWVVTHCNKNGHRLLKLWDRTFHEPSPSASGKHFYACPQCESGRKLAEAEPILDW